MTNTVNVTDPTSVAVAVEGIFLNLFRNANASIIHDAISYVAMLYRGEHPGYLRCDTGYHDLQHVLDVTLASARLMDGYERSQNDSEALGKELFILGILVALFHDSGYLRIRGVEEGRRGAEFTRTHVSRSAELLRDYMLRVGMGAGAEAASQIVHFTGYEIPADLITVPFPAYRAIGHLVASADILAQMSDRCYLEKCCDRLFTEFVLGGVATKLGDDGNKQIVYASAQDMVIQTPQFYRRASKRLDETLMGVYRYAEKHFGGRNLYVEAIEKNMLFAEYVIANNADIGMLRRTPPKTPGSDGAHSESDDRKKLVEDRRKRIGDRRQNTSALYPALSDRRRSRGDRRRAAK